MKRGVGAAGAFAAAIMLLSGGCAVNPQTAQSYGKRTDAKHAHTERDVLADAALAVETSPWPKPEPVSIFSRMTGASDDDRVTRSDAVAVYVNALQPAGARFSQLAIDARANLGAADRLLRAADHALAAQRLTVSDVAMVEDAIQALRENRQIYVSAAREIENAGEPIDGVQLEAIRDAYSEAIRELGRSADALADRIDEDRSENYAAPAKPRRNRFSGV